MFALPMFLIADAAPSVRTLFDVLGWGFAIGGIVLGYFAAAKYVPAARAALREGRTARLGRKRGGVMKAVILAGRRGHAAAAAHEQPAEADDADRERADDGAHRPAAREARLRRHRGHRRVPREPHPQLLRRRLRVRRADALRHRGVAARYRRFGPQRDGRARRDVPRRRGRRAHRHRSRRGDEGAPRRRRVRRRSR